MKTYVLTTGVLFGLLTVLHVWRMLEERALLAEPWYLLLTVVAALLTLWAARLAWSSRRRSG